MADDRRRSFDSVAAAYDAARPDYPAELFDAVVEAAGLQPGARLLEVGCGTGKATRPFLERGFEVVGVELGEHLAEEARRRLGITVEVAPFEQWDGPPASFDLVYAATAWHWVDPAVGYGKAHALLRPGGHLAVWSARHSVPPDADPFFAEMQEVYERLGAGGQWPPPVPDETAAIEAAGLFDVVVTRPFLWAVDYTAEEYIALLDTFSDHIAMPPAERAVLDAEVRRRLAARRVRRHWLAVLQVARRVEG